MSILAGHYYVRNISVFKTLFVLGIIKSWNCGHGRKIRKKEEADFTGHSATLATP